MGGCAIVFLIVFGAVWCTIGGLFISAVSAVNAGATLFGLFLLGAGLVGLGFGVNSVLKTYVLRIEPEVLTVSSGGSQQTVSATINRREITRVFVRMQIVQSISSTEQGATVSNSQVWSVVAYTPSAVKVLPSAGRRQCEWLGNLLGGWAECLVETDN